MTKLLPVVCLMLATASLWSQQIHPSPTSAKILEAKIRKAWQDYKNKDKVSFAAIFAEDFRCIKEGASDIQDKKSEVDGIDQFDLKQYTLSNFNIQMIGTAAALATYAAEYSGDAAGEHLQQKSGWSEVWMQCNRVWKLVYLQETQLK